MGDGRTARRPLDVGAPARSRPGRSRIANATDDEGGVASALSLFVLGGRGPVPGPRCPVPGLHPFFLTNSSMNATRVSMLATVTALYIETRMPPMSR